MNKIYDYNLSELDRWVLMIVYGDPDGEQLWLDTQTQKVYCLNDYDGWEELDSFPLDKNKILLERGEEGDAYRCLSDQDFKDLIDECLIKNKAFNARTVAETFVSKQLEIVKSSSFWEKTKDYDLIPTVEEQIAYSWEWIVLEITDEYQDFYDEQKLEYDRIQEDKEIEAFLEETGWDYE